MVKYSLEHKGVIFFFYFLMVVMGLGALETIGKQENPEFPEFNAVIMTKWPGSECTHRLYEFHDQLALSA